MKNNKNKFKNENHSMHLKINQSIKLKDQNKDK